MTTLQWGKLMKTKWLVFSSALALTGFSMLLHAEGNEAAGKTKSASCTSCHGDQGNSMVSTFPKLAQQHPSYLIKQLRAFKDGSRKDPMMSAMAAGLSDADIADIAAYYAEQKISHNAMPMPDDEDDDNAAASEEAVQKTIAAGANLYRNGNLTAEVSACIACHGPNGEGNQPAGFPALRSQHADYLIKTLSDFKSGARGANPDNMMRMIAKKMTPEDIKAVSYRISMMK